MFGGCGGCWGFVVVLMGVLGFGVLGFVGCGGFVFLEFGFLFEFGGGCD